MTKVAMKQNKELGSLSFLFMFICFVIGRFFGNISLQISDMLGNFRHFFFNLGNYIARRPTGKSLHADLIGTSAQVVDGNIASCFTMKRIIVCNFIHI